ncbi:MAG: quinol:cytochrome c oxidoreductase monoheme cytochrome subunit [Bryobacterales bacterium]|nr:quinol:cytochrome c oxidoreductase monoheme cytochrome subunit [Bryobacterales bacterium]
MHDQPRYKPLGETGFFADKRQSRPLIPGTVARGDLREATEFYTGKNTTGSAAEGTDDLDYFPIAITKEVIERGHERFDVFCSPCHGRLGNGLGMIVQRGMKQPPSYHTDRLRTARPGHFYDVITNGYGAMYNYSAQVSPRDRWAIVSYIRALQYSQNVNKTNLTPEQLAKLPVPGARPVPGEESIPDLPIAPPSPDQMNLPEGAPLPPGAPPTPMSPSILNPPPAAKAGEAKQ